MSITTATGATELDALSALVDKPMRIMLTDGRIIEGNFECADKDFNFILGQATEFYGASDVNFTEGEAKSSRAVGMVVIPGKHIVSCCIAKKD